MSSNPILFEGVFPPFSEINPKEITSTIQDLLKSALEKVDSLLKQELAGFDDLVKPLEVIDDRLSRSWSVVSHLQSVKSHEAIREAYEQCLPALSDYSTQIGQNKKLFDAFACLQADQSFHKLTAEQRALIEHAVRDFKLSGVALEGEDKARYAALSAELSQLTNTFSNNSMDATDHWHLTIDDEARIAGLPSALLESASQSAVEAGEKGWRFGLDFPTYLAVITYAQDRELRQTFYKAYVTRASDQGLSAKQWDNTPVMEQILSKRHELAVLLGFENYAQYSLATKMAASTEEVLKFYEALIQKAKPAAQKEFKALQAFAQSQGLEGEMRPWDVSFYSEKCMQAQFDISQEAMRVYFPLEKVLSGLFEITHRLYGVTIQPIEDKQVWDEQVQCFAIYDEAQAPIAYFYLDPYARKAKRSGAWMDECASRFSNENQVQPPVAYLVTNFRPPSPGKSALLTHDDVVTLFHEFGHGLHHMLTKGNYPSTSGINGVPWDAVELPSQFYENWCWNAEALALISSHIDSGDSLPIEIINKLKASKNFGAGMMMVRQIELGLFDFLLHVDNASPNVRKIITDIRNRVSVMPAVDYNRFENTFTHIFSGGYAAGYYSYLWAEVLSADAFSAFEENGIFDAKTGARFKQCILEKGGSESPAKMFEDFRGRAPAIEPLLRQEGLIK